MKVLFVSGRTNHHALKTFKENKTLCLNGSIRRHGPTLIEARCQRPIDNPG